MDTPRHALTSPRERIIEGARNWWFLGPGGTARLDSRHLTADARLRPLAERQLRAEGLFTPSAYRSYSLTVLTSTDCNLGCGYCFQNTGTDTEGSRPPRIAHARLTVDTIERILHFTRRQMAQVGLDRLRLLLFGGEPLLNPRGCRELLSRAADLGLAGASMTSNGTLLTPLLAKELSALGLDIVQVTFDGDQADHDQIRVARTGGTTFEVILRNMARVTQVAPIRWNIRINVSHLNVDGIGALIERLAERLDPARCAISLARVGDIGIGYHNDLLHTGALAAAFAGWQRRALDLGFRVPPPRPQTPCQMCSFKNGRYGAVVSADGTIASCWETAGRPEWTVGSVDRGYLPAEQLDARWTSCETSYQYGDDQAALARFHDQVDADLLDYLDATGRFPTPTAAR
ncbi:MAG TPA: radical SAM protein [Pseudonocardiaceae bacterium]|jgi:uncharacterized protein|nr:radical SAM protein [Pseudonocardiaceae bacterium]